jgi:thioredoxin-like negative regulator of GroEL
MVHDDGSGRKPGEDSSEAWEAMFPTCREVVEIFGGLLCLVRVDPATYPELAEPFKIRVSPTLLLFKHGVPPEFIVGMLPTCFVIETLSTALGVRPKLHALGLYTARADHRGCPVTHRQCADLYPL